MSLVDLAVNSSTRLPFGSVLDAASRALIVRATRLIPTKTAYACDPTICNFTCIGCVGCAAQPCCSQCQGHPCC